MITIYEEIRYVWICPECGKWNYVYGNPKHKDKIMCQKCGVAFTEFKSETDEEGEK